MKIQFCVSYTRIPNKISVNNDSAVDFSDFTVLATDDVEAPPWNDRHSHKSALHLHGDHPSLSARDVDDYRSLRFSSLNCRCANDSRDDPACRSRW